MDQVLDILLQYMVVDIILDLHQQEEDHQMDLL